MKARIILTLAVIPGIAFAQQPVPPISTTTLPPPVPLLNAVPIPLTPKETHALSLSSTWANRPEMPVAGDNGRVLFLYGATIPSVVCAPLHVCDITLQPGEVVNNIEVGDSIRWKVTPAVSGTGPDQTTHVVVKPTDAGLSTDLIITTDRRTYTIKLVSTTSRWMGAIGFNYPDEVQAQWRAYETRMQRERDGSTLASGQNVADLNFNYRITGDNPPWRPLRVYSDGVKTYIDFPHAMLVTDAPALVALDADDNKQLVNYRVKGAVFVVDKLLTRAELISGVGGSQQAVYITAVGGG